MGWRWTTRISMFSGAMRATVRQTLCQHFSAGEGKKGFVINFISCCLLPIFVFLPDLLSRTHIWTLEGDVGHAPLLDFALNEQNLSKSMAIVVLDFSQPWTLVESFEKWLKVLENHIEVLKTKLGPGEFSELQKRSTQCSFLFLLRIIFSSTFFSKNKNDT